MVRVPSSRVLLTGAVTAALAVTTVVAVALTGSPEGAVALPRFAPSPPGSSLVLPTVDAPPPTLDDPGTVPPLPALPAETRPPAPRRTAEAPPTTQAPPSTRERREQQSSVPRTSRSQVAPPSSGASMDERVRFACAQGYLNGPMCGQ
ncbi:MAG: hypothetical protein J0I34_29855 [Pseudonocardia sp.]|uniref:hypothetical protein n=1 Tax=unclassified Pseudonocardia TaxID=2619320 RepID=UPI0008685A6D|nr:MULTISPECIES: hypothetical protein [unclassified Pseudonocardia]MBN9112978.1 hypothetical protein [Pseudonocardia sp.]ODV05612.1 MAG: hypothetical protein ABT15_15945 [Pseudonocardia sp. SCN 73-27]